MRLMKKLRSNGGYALVYVVVAMTLLLAIVGGLGLTAVRNLRTQQSAVSLLQSRYEAAGEVEKVFTKIWNNTEVTYDPSAAETPSAVSLLAAGEGAADDEKAAINEFVEKIKGCGDSGMVSVTSYEYDDSVLVTVTATVSGATVKADLLVKYAVKKEEKPNPDSTEPETPPTVPDTTEGAESDPPEEGGEPTEPAKEYTYTVSVTSVSYQSYSVEYTEAGA